MTASVPDAVVRAVLACTDRHPIPPAGSDLMHIRPDLPGERWRPVPGREGHYEVSDLGRVWSTPNLDAPPHRRGTTGIIMSQPLTHKGYRYVRLVRGTKPKTICIHQLVLQAFVGPMPQHAEEVRHLDGNKLNNRLTNLAYGTRSENQQDTVRHGMHPHARKTTCPAGHPYDEKNTYRAPSRPRERRCRACERVRASRNRAVNARGAA